MTCPVNPSSPFNHVLSMMGKCKFCGYINKEIETKAYELLHEDPTPVEVAPGIWI